jgi:predicted nucleotidyltransferase
MSQKQSVEDSLSFRAMRERLIRLEEKDKQEHYQKALQTAKNLAAMLKENYRVKAVYLYGSLAWGGFNNNSDIDLYLAGFEGNYWRAYSEAEAMASPICISLACEENCFATLKAKVMEKGVLL